LRHPGKIERDREKADQHREIAPIQCVKRGREDFDRRILHQPDRIKSQRRSRLLRGRRETETDPPSRKATARQEDHVVIFFDKNGSFCAVSGFN
jgi:hypothetical protein